MRASNERWYLRALVCLATRGGDQAAVDALKPRLERAEAEHAERWPATRLAQLCHRLALEETERELFASVIAFSGDPRLPVHAEALGGPLARRGLAVSVFAELAEISPDQGQQLVGKLGPDHPLLRDGLLLVADHAAAPAARPYQVSSRLLAYVAGQDICERGVTVVAPVASWIYDANQQLILEQLRGVLAREEARIIVIEGRAGMGRRSAIAHVLGREVVVLDAERLEVDEFETAFLALRREACLRDTIAVLSDADRIAAELKRRLPSAVESFGGRLVVTSSEGVDLASSRAVMRLRWPSPDVEHRRRLWVDYARYPTGDLEQLSLRYRVGAGAISRAVASARTMRPEGTLDAQELSAGLRHNIGERMAGLAERIEVTQRWEDVVLAEDVIEQVLALIARVRHSHQVLEQWGFRRKMARGTGIAALFSGPPGTGKTMVAGLLAYELGLELYQVDLSQITSKWVGETEKQLARVFDAAEEGHALLLFDEADSLFGQRSADIKGAVDRHANLEVNFLLQRIESFGGITVLTTNLDANIDRALKRRLASHIVFAIPDEEERGALWARLATTSSAPVSRDVEFAQLARAFPMMSGANIRNAAFSAAFMAASDGAAQIAQVHLIRAARAEYRSMGHVLAEAMVGSSIAGRANK